MMMVGTDEAGVERSLLSGELVCPSCSGLLAPWGHARSRSSRGPEGTVRHRPRRARCSSCRGTHVLLAQAWLWRRADAVSVIGAALEAKAAGAGHRSIAARLGRPACTVRGWLRRFTVRAEQERARFTRLLVALDPLAGPLVPRASVVADALEALGAAAAAAVLRLSPQPAWELAARATGGRLLAPVGGSRW
ncbi:MAG: hypothetical protein L0H78_25850 [Humibacillus sp.]|nr:hypothetical protein [Humibacillus sp.]